MTTTTTDGLGSGPPHSGGTKDEARAQAQQVAGTAKQEAGRVADEARHQVRGLLDEATTQVTEQTTQQKDRIAGTVRSFADDLQQLRSGEQPSGLAADVVDQVQRGARDLAERLEGREPAELLDDVRRFARQRPGTFLLGALAAGVVVGRLVRGQRDATASNGSSTGYTGTTGTTGTTTVGTPGPRPVGTPGETTRVAPVPPTDDDASPAYLTGTGVGDGSEVGSEAGPSWTGTETPPVTPPVNRPGGPL